MTSSPTSAPTGPAGPLWPAPAWYDLVDVVLPERTGDRMVVEAAEVLVAYLKSARRAQWRQACGEALVEAQVCLADAQAVLRLYAALPSWTAAADLVGSVAETVAQEYPQMGLRDAIGWALGCQSDAVPLALAARLSPLIGRWAAVGLADRGWLYAAAGLTPAEALAGLEAKSLSEDDVRALAALRGQVPLPA